MMMTQNGKLLYISDNAAEYLGHSMVSEKEFQFYILQNENVMKIGEGRKGPSINQASEKDGGLEIHDELIVRKCKWPEIERERERDPHTRTAVMWRERESRGRRTG